MAKTVLKEIIIILLLILATILLLGITLYNYVPMYKVVPEKVSYKPTQEVQQISNEMNKLKEDMPITSYTVTASDLTDYKRVNEYVAGRKNPFASLNTGKNNTTTSGAANTGSATSANTNTGSTSSNNNASSNNNNSQTSNNNSQTNNNSNSSNSNNSNNSQNNNNNAQTSTEDTSTNYYPDKGIK